MLFGRTSERAEDINADDLQWFGRGKEFVRGLMCPKHSALYAADVALHRGAPSWQTSTGCGVSCNTAAKFQDARRPVCDAQDAMLDGTEIVGRRFEPRRPTGRCKQ